MNAVEIEAAVSELAQQPFDAEEFPFQFLAAFGNKDTTIKRLRKRDTNKSDVPGGILHRSHIHLAVAEPGEVEETFQRLKASPKTTAEKAKYILATDGQTILAEELASGENLACEYADLPNHFGIFLPLAGITTVAAIKENPFDIRATSRLNKLYVELLKENPDWATEERRPDLNHFFARIIFCFFAEDTGIFNGTSLFTDTVRQMTEPDGSNTAEVLSRLFRIMNVDHLERARAEYPGWEGQFPYVNGGLFSGSADVPRFTRTARSYLLSVGDLNWKSINPDIFGSMIQAVADDDERGSLGMHYTSVPNILKVLNPLFLDDLRAQLERAGDHKASLLRLRERLARIRVFDPACGSGNFLVIAYKQMRAIEAEINRRRGEEGRPSVIPIKNFRGIEIRDFAAEIARLALVIAEYQEDERYRGHQNALLDFLPLAQENWIWKGNALRLDWTTVCPPLGSGVKVQADDLFGSELPQTEIDFANAGGEVFVCGNPPYLGFTWQSDEQKSELKSLFEAETTHWKSLDYVGGWFLKAAKFGRHTGANIAFVSTNSISQGEQVPILWPIVFKYDHSIDFAFTSFKWSNLASNKAGVTVAVIGYSTQSKGAKTLYATLPDNTVESREVPFINAYLVPSADIIIQPRSKPISELPTMVWGNKATDGGNLILTSHEYYHLSNADERTSHYIRPYFGSAEFIRGRNRYCIWVGDDELADALQITTFAQRFKQVCRFRLASKANETKSAARFSHRFRQIQGIAQQYSLIISGVSSESREYLPVGLLPARSIISNLAFALYDAPIWNLALIASRLHLVWIGTVCGKLETRYRYSNTLGWNTFPVPPLTEDQKADLTTCAEEILLAREAHFPATIADLYDPERMPDDLRRAHERNDETLERIYIGRRFKNDTERLEKLFAMYAEMTAQPGTPKKIKAKK